MRKILMSLIIVGSLLLAGACHAAGLHDCPKIAVLPFGFHAAMAQDGKITLEDAAVASDYVVEALIDTDRFEVMEREQLQAILNEHHLNLTGLVDTASAAQIGKLAGVKYLVYGAVTGCSLKETHVKYSGPVVGAGNNQHNVIANVVGRFIDVETGRIVLAARGYGESTSTSTKISFSALHNNNSGGGDGTEDTTDSSDASDATDSTDSSETSGVSDSSSDVTYSSDTTDSSETTDSYTTYTSGDSDTTDDSDTYTDDTDDDSDDTDDDSSTIYDKSTHTISFGTTEVSQVQVHNAIAKAADNLVYGSKGFLAKMDGKAKKKHMTY